MLFCNSDIKSSFRHLFHHNVKRAACRHCRSNACYLIVKLREFKNSFSKYFLVSKRCISNRGIDYLTSLFVELARCMECCLVLLSLFKAFAFNGKAMKQFWSGDSLQVLEDFGQVQYIMAVNRTKISEIKPLKKITPVEYRTFSSGFKLGGKCPCIRSKFPKYSKNFPYPVLEPVICFTRSNVKQILLQGTYIDVDGHIVIIKNYKYIGLTNSCIIETFESLTCRHSTITDNCHNRPVLPFSAGSDCHTESCRN